MRVLTIAMQNQSESCLLSVAPGTLLGVTAGVWGGGSYRVFAAEHESNLTTGVSRDGTVGVLHRGE